MRWSAQTTRIISVPVDMCAVESPAPSMKRCCGNDGFSRRILVRGPRSNEYKQPKFASLGLAGEGCCDRFDSARPGAFKMPCSRNRSQIGAHFFTLFRPLLPSIASSCGVLHAVAFHPLNSASPFQHSLNFFFFLVFFSLPVLMSAGTPTCAQVVAGFTGSSSRLGWRLPFLLMAAPCLALTALVHVATKDPQRGR